MLTKRLTYCLLVCLLACGRQAHAQDSLLFRDYQFVKQQDAWLTSTNAAGLTRYQSRNMAEAELSLGMGRGRFVNYYEPSKTLELTADIESFYRISPRTVLYGRMGYDNWTGRNMTGSAFMHILSSTYPFDIVEDSLTNPGRKHRDTYQLTGAVGCQVTNSLAMGLRVDYTAANYAKYKDLRHKNKLMDLEATAGITFAPFSSLPVPPLTLGANYRYHRNTESVTFGTYGKNDKVYKSFIDYANFAGRVEQFGNYGYTDKSREMPLFDEGHGVDIQLEVVPVRGLKFHNNFSYSHRKGYYGRQSPYTITFTNHDGNKYAYDGRLSYRSTQTLQQLSVSIVSEQLQNNAKTYRELTNEAGSYYYEYYDDVKTGNKLWVNTNIGYTAHLGIHEELPTWTLHADLQLMHRKQTAYVYPYLRRQKLSSTRLSLQATRNIMLHTGVLSVCTNVSYLKGRGEPWEDDTFATPSDKQTSPDEMEAFAWQEYQYLTAPQYSIGGSTRYDFVIPGTHLKTHAALNIQHQKSNNIYYEENGKDHTHIYFAVGCTF